MSVVNQNAQSTALTPKMVQQMIVSALSALRLQGDPFDMWWVIFAIRLNHTMSDASGLVQFMMALGEMARGAHAPSVQPVWQRELLNARDPPHVLCVHHEFDKIKNTNQTALTPLPDLVGRSFFFGPKEVSALRKHLPPHLRMSSTTFEVLTACLWRCRTIALNPDPNEIVRLTVIVNARNRFRPPLPVGYYGNACSTPTVLSTARKLCESPVEYALGLVKETKTVVTDEYMRSLADLIVIRGRPNFTLVGCAYVVSNVSRSGLKDVDFGWGKAVYGGPSAVGPEASTYSAATAKERKGLWCRWAYPGPLWKYL
uniref:Benzyl alcohol O-benzoyltransferase-like n=1 Tax=Nelumbo nucifera TaxID=4432 RepID=A0A822Y154_NELNU|nr:TPA_asm: hypothetical protein HUJ06_026473 [Nelumbo nucifera]